MYQGNKSVADRDCEVLSATSEYEATYANMCAIADWLSSSSSIPTGYTKAHIAFIVRALVNFIRTEEFGKVINPDDKYLGEVPTTDIKSFLYRNASRLGITDVTRIGEIVDFFKDKVIRGGSEVRYYAGIDMERNAYVEQAGNFVVGKVTTNGIQLSSRFLQSYGMIIDFSAFKGKEMMDASAYIAEMAIKAYDIDMVLSSLTAAHDQAMRVGREVMDRCTFWRQHFAEFDSGSVMKEIDKWIKDLKESQAGLQKLEVEINAMTSEEFENSDQDDIKDVNQKLEKAKDLLRRCIMACDSVVDALFKYGETLKETANMHLLATPTDSVFDFNKVVFDRLSFLSTDSMIELYYRFLLKGGIADPRANEGGFDTDLTFHSLMQFPEPAIRERKEMEVVFEGEYTESDLMDTSSRLENEARAVSKEFTKWIQNLPEQKGTFSTFVETLDDEAFENVWNLSIFDRVALAEPNRAESAAWSGLKPCLEKVPDSGHVSFINARDESKTHIEFTDYVYKLKGEG